MTTGWNSIQGIERSMIASDGIRYHTVRAGNGTPVVLLAGFPQSSYAWRRVLPLLAPHHTVVAIDLPGQGDSDKPIDGYDTKTTAERLRRLIREQLGFDRFFLVGHDIGSWATYPYAATYGEDLSGCVLLDGNIAGVTLPATLTVGPENWKSWHFLFHPVPDLPEILITGRERAYLEWFLFRKTANPAATYSEADLAEYERCLKQTGNLRGALAYYRAVYENMAHNAHLPRVTVPMLALGGQTGSAPNLYEALRPLGDRVEGGVIADCGHFIPEEKPDELAALMLAFFAAHGTGGAA
ncbi:alpha/beta fold hydrolase [Enterovirga rhinocerotis]|uniref:Pimeloyl-ACP methyl ester carboxylesterase n=1 Tax=Enterovirga rhinocerotis TaxID=1339210 RepID=A0A4R7C492_9HYPH|nr:alpha/beta hydrolase [Enterovirga rhinocerotis]TDR92961.1 pimeloyl-ACP methyl ester carboxylesterase [Enterovirga rhinocerotis]